MSRRSNIRGVIVTLAAEGCEVWVDGQCSHVPGVQATGVVDPTGCGDAFRGALLFGLLAEDPGYLLLEWRGYAIESTAVAALALAACTPAADKAEEAPAADAAAEAPAADAAMAPAADAAAPAADAAAPAAAH
jgi:sugar/nucleoside kinase (ribokinase family)